MRQRTSSSRAILLVFWVCWASSASVGQTLIIEAGEAGAGGVGADLIVGALHSSLASYGSEGGISAFAVGTTLCNLGDEEVQWVSNNNEHPVVAHNIYRLKDDRFEQVGVSWVKHENMALQSNRCDAECQPSGTGMRLGVGCATLSGASMHGVQAALSPRWQVDANTGYFAYPPTRPPLTGSILERRLQVHDVDLDPATNEGALYFVEGQHVAADDAEADNGNNNASYAPISFWWDSGSDKYRGSVDGGTQPEQAGIRAWQDNDPAVVEADVQVPGEGLFILAAKAIDLENGDWEYSYALQNLNSDRSCGVFRVPVPSTARVAAIRFHDVDYHSGEPYDGTDWTATRSGDVITWATTDFDINPNANALRWGTLYSFRFQSDAPPAETSVTLGLFKPGDPAQVTAPTIGPSLIDCNGNDVPDACDIDCAALGCTAPCGESDDCQPNGVPDECEADCDGDGIPDDCDAPEDCDNDGTGPDLIVGALHSSLASYGSEGGISAFAVGTTLCNLGDEEVQWVSDNNEHPVVAHNIYRLKDDRFEQIGVSWVKHENTALQGNACLAGCQSSGTFMRLGVGCSDASTAGIHGAQAYLSLRSEVDGHTGYFPFPPTRPPLTGSILERRLQVHDVDLDPAMNEGALYFVEGQHIAADDAEAGNGNNNASYARISFWWDAGRYRPMTTGQTQPEQAGIRAWQDNDPAVVETDVQVPGEGLFILAAKAIDLENGGWEYSYALQNLNSDRSCGVFRVPVPGKARVAAIRFHDVDYHSGEPYDGTDWTATRSDQAITWTTTSFDINPNANALRWGTLYSFRFQSDAPPVATSVTLGLFKPGDPAEVTARTIGPTMGSIDCNGNEIPDACDIDCAAFGCTAPCGESYDCQPNGVPDECEADCNGDGLPDDCDDTPSDCDDDGIPDCLDLCRCTSDPGACVCPLTGFCCFPDELCIPDYPHASCCALRAIPDCPCEGSPCIAGCMLEEVNGDSDRDGDSDMKDTSDLVACFSGPAGEPGFVEPPDRCRARFDFDADGDIDHSDYKTFQSIYTGP